MLRSTGLLLLSLLAAAGCDSAPKPYNVILISIDTLRADHLAGYGYHRDTAPNIERFAGKAVLFENAYSQSPWTTPSHATMFTSLYPKVLNIGHWPNPGGISPNAYTLAECLRDEGYRTSGYLEAGMVAVKFGFNQGFKPYRQGFKHIHESVPVCLDWIRENRTERFFVFLHTYDVHRYNPPEEFSGLFDEGLKSDIEKGIPLARQLQVLKNHDFLEQLGDDDRDKIVAIYDESIRYVDHWLGVFFDALAEAGLEENTIVVLTSDHGEEFWEHEHTGHGYTNFEEMLHVPLIIRHPDIEPGRRSAMVGLIDLAPTVADMVGARIRSDWQGQSFYPLLSDASSAGVRFTFAEAGHIDRQSALDGRWKLVRTHRSKARKTGPLFKDRLYDLERDPSESRDAAEEHPDVLARMQALLESWDEANERLRGGYQALEVEMDPDLKKQLENLGYTGGKK